MAQTDLQEHARVGRPPAVGREPPDEKVITPAKRRLKLRDVPRTTPIIRVLAARDLKVKYKQSLLGPLWLVFQPMALLAAFFVAFRGIADVGASGLPYVLFALVGLTIWSFFQAAMTIGTASVVTNGNFVRFTPCPRSAFPIASVIASLPAYGVTIAAALATAAITGHLSLRVLLLPLSLLWLLILTMGLVWISSSLAVRYRDINSALPFLLQVGVFLAPVGYPLADLSSSVRAIVNVNPLTGIIEASRWMMLSGYECAVEPILLSLATTVVVVIAGWQLFSRRETTMADEI